MSYVQIYYPNNNLESTLGKHTTGVTALRFSPDGKHVLSGEQAGLLKIWGLSILNRKKGELKGHLDAVTSISMTGDSRIIGSSSSAPSYLFTWLTDKICQFVQSDSDGDYLARVRARGTDECGNVSAWSDWKEFSFHVDCYVSEDSAGSGVA